MKKVSLLILSIVCCLSWRAFSQSVTTFNYTGGMQSYTVPQCVTSLLVDVQGAPGGKGGYSSYPSEGGRGGRVLCNLAVTPGQVLNIFVGGTGQSRYNTSSGSGTSLPGGYNGGGNGFGYYNGSGGGMSDIRVGGTAFPGNAVVVAGGGGGGCYNGSANYNGGDGGSTTADMGWYNGSQAACNAGGGGTPSSGGAMSTCYTSHVGGNGSQGQGGNATVSYTYCAGGGAGWWGGGCGTYGGGGGGSSYTHTTLCTNVTHVKGYNSSLTGGRVIIYAAPAKVFNYTGSVQTYTVPAGVTKVNLDLIGARGGHGGTSTSNSYSHYQGGWGGRVQCDLDVTPGQVLNVYVGDVGGTGMGSCCSITAAGGYNGGGTGSYAYCGGGGGMTDVRVGGTTFTTNTVAVAGGGGGGSYSSTTSDFWGGHGGGTTAGNGLYYNAFAACNSGTGGSQSGGGIVGTCYTGSFTSGAGAPGQGGNGNSSYGAYAGGGGGGWYGGGVGVYAGGGGGSSYTKPGVTSNVIHTQGFNYSSDGKGIAVITPLTPIATLSPSSLSFGSATPSTTSSPLVFGFSVKNLTPGGSLVITPPSNFQISLDGITYSSSPLTIPYTVVDYTQTVFVRFAPSAVTSYSGNVTISGGGLPCTVNVAVNGNGAAACSGTPTAGTTVVAPTSGNSATAFSLSLSGASSSGGLNYQWQSAPTSGGTYTNISGANMFTLSFSGLTTTTWYRCVVGCGTNTVTSTPSSATFAMTASSCTPTSGANSSSYYATTSGQPFTVTGASGSISDASSWGSGTGGSSYYYNNIGLNVTFNRGSSYTATMGVSGLCYSSGQIWIDFNDNGTFSTDETVGGYSFWSGTTTCPSGRPQPVITIPSNAAPGAHRMRVIHSYNGNNAPGASVNYVNYPMIPPCPTTTQYYVDTRDYTAIIAAPPTLTGTVISNFGNAVVGSASVPVGVTKLNASNLIPAAGYVTLTAPTGYKLSIDGVSWASTLNVGYVGGGMIDQNVYVQFIPSSATTFSGNVVVAGGGLLSSVNLAVTGAGVSTVCSGSPTAGTASASPASGAFTTSVTLSLSGTTAAGNLFYQWQSAPATTGPWTNIADGVYSTYSFKGITATTYYRCIVTCGTGSTSTSNTATVTYVPPTVAASSCTPLSYTNCSGCGFYVTNGSTQPCVITGAGSSTLTDASAYLVSSGTYYINNTSMSVNFLPGGSYSVTAGGLTSNPISWHTWIDFNNNGSFDNATELVGGVAHYNNSAVRASWSINIPAGVTPGLYRMRVLMNYDANYAPGANSAYPCYPLGNPCPGNTSTNTYYADTRDYTAVIVTPSCSGRPQGGIVDGAPVNSCSAFTATAINVGETAMPGVTYQWQSSSSPSSGFTNISGATNTVYSPSFSSVGTIYYRDSMTCSNSGLGAVSQSKGFTFLAPPAAIGGNLYQCSGTTTTLTNATSGGTWTSGTTSVATIAPTTGVVSAISAGTTMITYTAPSGCQAFAEVTVNTSPAATITGNGPICGGGGPTSVTLGNSVSGGTWTSSNAAQATVVSSTGVATGVATGNPVITYTMPGGCFTTATMTVNAVSPLVGVPSICIGYSATLSTASTGGTWSSSAPGVATVNSSGVVTSVSLGTTVISYTVSSIGCAAVLTVNVTNPPTVKTVTGGGSLCSGGTGVTIGLNGSDAGISYYLYNGATLAAGPVIGTGGVINFGVFSAAGTYGVVANPGTPCATNMSGTATVVVNPLPTAYTVSGGGNYCVGGTGVNIYLSSSIIGINYQLMLGSVPVGAPVAGTSASLNFGLQTATGTYTVVATNATTGCVNNMTGSATVGTNALPASFAVTGGGGYCAGGTGVPVGLSGSVIGVNYQLVLSGAPVGTPVAGTGSALNFGTFTAGGNYTVVATDATTSCVANMSGSATVVINPLPTVFNMSGGGNYCVGGTGVVIGLNGSTAGVSYQLYRGGTLVSGAVVSGTGVAISFGTFTTTGTYTVVATNSTTGCVNNMAGSAIVATNALPLSYSVTGGGNYCAGGTGLPVGLSGSQTSVDYQLFCNGTLVGAGSGTGGAINFGLQLAPGVYTIVATNPTTGCINNMTGSVTIVVNPIPNVYNVTQAATNYCAGAAGVNIGLSGSQSGVNYQLYNSGVPVGTAVAGTGSALSFGAKTAGTYTVVALNPSTTCTINMAGSAVITENSVPSVYIMTGGGSYCTGGTGLPVGLSSSNTGINYQLKNGSTNVGPATPGTGFSINFGIISTGGTYTVIATNPATGCTSNMSGSSVVSVNGLPAAFTVTGGGNYCTGGSGVPVGLFGSGTGVYYQLYNGSTAVGSVVSGTGVAVTFGAQTLPGAYTVLATDSATGCTNNMTGSVPVAVNPLPALFVVTGGGNYCSGDAGVAIGISGSAAGVNYQLMNGTTAVGAPVPGTGASLSFGMQTAAGTYKVVATNVVTGCSNTMTGSAVVNVNPLPASFAINGGGNYCVGGAGVAVGLSGSSTGVNYQLYAGSVAAGAPRAGTGAPLSFGLQTLSGIYTIIATNVATGCSATMAGTTNVNINSLPALHTVTGGGNYCTGGTGVDISLDGSNSGTSYQLYMGSVAMGSAVPGSSGSPINFGPQTVAGVYTVLATNTTTSCSNTMTGSASVGLHPLPTVYSVTGGGNYCAGTAGVNIGLGGSNSGVLYQLMNGSSTVGAPIIGSGAPITFGTHTTTGIYTVAATASITGCNNNMGGSVTVAVNPLPVQHNVTGGGNYCSGAAGLHVGLDGSNSGTAYQLMNGLTAVGAPMLGTGAAIDFGVLASTGNYTVMATNTTTSCSSPMTGSTSINIDPLPTAYALVGGGNYCSGGTGVTVGMVGSDPGVTYQLMNGGTAIGAPITGTGTALDFGLQTAAGTYSVVATNTTTGCINPMTGTVVIGVNTLPTAYTVTGGGNYCAGGAGSRVMLGGSSAGVSYQLMNGVVPAGSPVLGTGLSLDFGLQLTPGTYTVEATNNTSGCTNTMSGSTTINISPLPATYTVGASGTSYCAGGSGIDINIGGSDLGINYQLYNGVTPVGSPRAGTGLALGFGSQLIAGTYTIVGTSTATGCSNTMTGSAAINVNALPSVFSVTGGGNYCAGGSGVMVGLSGSSVGITYELIKDGSATGTIVSGTSGPLSFGLQSGAGVYTVIGTNSATSCTKNMNGTATVTVTTAPAAFTVTGGGNYCAGGPGSNVTLSGSAMGVSYQLYRGLTAIGGPVAGTGSALNLGAQTAVGSYNVVATSGSCVSNMTGSVTVGVNPAPSVFPMIGGGNYCPGGTGVHVGISGSSLSASYQLFKDGTAVGSAIPGTGSGIDFGLQTEAGAYTVKASDNTTTCGSNMSGSVSVTVSTLPTAFTVVGGGNYCAGGSGVHVGLSGSSAGVNYTLYKGFSSMGVKTGTGGPIDFGAQTGGGIYSVLATNASTGCQATMTGTVNVVVDPLVAPTVSLTTATGDTVCEGSLVTFTAAITGGGSAPAYQWTVNGAVAGTSSSYSYSPANGDVVNVTLTSSAACATPRSVSSSTTMTVDPNMNPAVAVTANPGTVICQGTSVTFSASPSFGGPTPTYSWVRNGVPSGSSSSFSYVPGNGDVVYCVMTSNYHCRLANTASSTHLNMDVASSVPPVVVVTATPGSNVAAGQSVTFSAAVTNAGPAPTYQWLVSGTPASGATLPTFTTANLANNDTVVCQVLSSGGCSGLLGSGGMRVRVHGVGVQQVSIANSDIRLLPNPNKGIFTVKGSLGFETNEDVAVEVTNMLGQSIYNSSIQAHNGEINERIELGKNIANGMYILSVRSGGESKVFHLIIEQ